MPSLLDIVPATEVVVIHGTPITVHGIGLGSIAVAMGASPDLAAMLQPAGRARGIDATRLLIEAPAAICMLIADACGSAGDTAMIDAVSKLPFGAQVDLVEAIIRLSFPGGILPFVARFTEMLGEAPPAMAQHLNGAGAIVEPVIPGAPPSTS